MKLALVFIVHILTLGTLISAPFDALSIAKKGIEDGQELMTGTTDASGIYVISATPIEPQKDLRQNIPQAELSGKQRIAGWISGEKISSSESSISEERLITVNNEEQYESFEVFKKAIRTDINTFLKGISMIGMVSHGDVEYIVLMVSEKGVINAETLRETLDHSSSNVVSTVGIASIIDGDISQAKALALKQAQQSAIEQVLGTSLVSADLVMNETMQSQVVAQTIGCIKQFRITSEGLHGHASYRVKIVAEVAKDELLASYSTLLNALGGITFHLHCENNTLETLIKETFITWGCTFTNEQSRATYIISCKDRFDTVTHPATQRTGTRCHFSLGITSAVTGEQVISTTNDARKSVSFNGNPQRQRVLSAEMAMKAIHNKIHEKLDALMGKLSAQGRELRIVIENYSPARAEELNIVVKIIQDIPGTQHIKLT